MFCVATWTARESLRNFIDLKGKLDLIVKRELRASDLALVIAEWSFSVAGLMVNLLVWLPNLLVLRQQADGTWQFVIDNP